MNYFLTVLLSFVRLSSVLPERFTLANKLLRIFRPDRFVLRHKLFRALRWVANNLLKQIISTSHKTITMHLARCVEMLLQVRYFNGRE